jgi:hypothetical protein
LGFANAPWSSFSFGPTGHCQKRQLLGQHYVRLREVDGADDGRHSLGYLAFDDLWKRFQEDRILPEKLDAEIADSGRSSGRLSPESSRLVRTERSASFTDGFPRHASGPADGLCHIRRLGSASRLDVRSPRQIGAGSDDGDLMHHRLAACSLSVSPIFDPCPVTQALECAL